LLLSLAERADYIGGMDQPSPPRRSFWRFSLRELLLLMLAIAAFLGWGRAIYQRYKPFVPTPFFSKLDLNGDIMLIRQQLGEPPASWVSSSASGSGGPSGYERDYRFGFPLTAGYADAFLSKLRQRLSDQLGTHHCQIHGATRGSTGDIKECRLTYSRNAVEGSVRAVVILSGDEARLLVLVQERRQSQ
jgi:hypothetical protein